jgi:hypothetical protein
MIVCSGCDTEQADADSVCPVCHPQEVSDPDAKLDELVQKAAVPSLSSLFRKAKTSGAIKPISGYGGTPTK